MFTFLIGNELYETFKAYTVRLYEVLAGGAIPIIEKSWLECFKNIVKPETFVILEKLSYSDEDSLVRVMNLLEKYSKSFEARKRLVEHLRESVLSVVSQDYVNSELAKTLDYVLKNPMPSEIEVRDTTESIIDNLYNSMVKSKFKRTRDLADFTRNNLREKYFISSHFASVRSNVGFMRGDYCFAASEFSDAELLEKFGG